MAKRKTSVTETPPTTAPVDPVAPIATPNLGGVLQAAKEAKEAISAATGIADASLGNVQPVADLPDWTKAALDGTIVQAMEGSFVWAMARAAEGLPVKRAAWLGLKAVDFTHPSGRVILENEDFAAQDWHIA